MSLTVSLADDRAVVREGLIFGWRPRLTTR
jgi:hypothetical protein